MKIKRLIALGLCSACLLAGLAGCRKKDDVTSELTQSGAAATEISVENGANSIEAIHTANNPITLLDQYATVEVNSSAKDGSGTEISTANLQYTRNEDGYIQSATHLKYDPIGDADGADYYSNTYQAEGVPGALYTVTEKTTYMVTYPANEYEDQVVGGLVCWPTDMEDSVESVKDNGDYLSVEVKSYLSDEPSYYFITTYTIDQSTLLISGMDIIAYAHYDEDASEDQVSSEQHYSFSYGGEYLPDGDTTVGALGGDEEKCDLTLVINPGENNEEIQNFKVNHGTVVSFDSKHTYEAYDNKEMKNAMETVSFDTTGKSATYYIRVDD